jgi:hypothetical protein
MAAMNAIPAAMLAAILPVLAVPQPEKTAPGAKKPGAKAPAAAPAKGEPKKDAAPALPVAFPHPLITEVLYAVPNSDDGDANKDGTRQAAGDEFVELINPHERAIQLFGYTLTDRNPEKKGQFKFTFPALELPAGGVVVVFNGFESSWSGVGPVGDSTKAPSGPNESFHGAYVFTARASSSRISWANGGDFVLLSDPSSQPIECVTWGTFKEKVPAAPLIETAPLTSKGSVQRESLAGAFGVYPASEKEPKVAFSPGEFGVAKNVEDTKK